MKQSLGAWEIHVNTEAMPEKIATAFDGLNQKWLGAKYRPIAYLGSQLVNGTNHAILGQQTMIDADNTKNVVLAVFNEPIFKGKIVEATLVYLEHILDTFSACGEIHVNDDFKITVEAQTAFDALIEKCTGVKVEPFCDPGYDRRQLLFCSRCYVAHKPHNSKRRSRHGESEFLYNHTRYYHLE